MKIKSTKNALKDHGIVALVYAESGVGKTTAIEQYSGKTFILDFNGGIGALSEFDEDYETIKTDLSNLKEVMDELKDPKGFISEYDNIAIDSISDVETNMLSAYARASKTESPTLQNYGQTLARIQQFLLDIRNLKFQKKNVIINALEMPLDEHMADGRIVSKLYPMLAAGKGKFARRLVAECDIVGHLEISQKEGTEGKRFLRLAKTENVVAKDRIFKREFCFPKEIFNPKNKKGE